MSKPFQFSMRLLFAEVSLLCVGAWLVPIIGHLDRERDVAGFFLSLVAMGATCGIAFGLPFGTPIKGAFVGAMLTCLGIILLCIWLGLSFGGFGG